MLLRCKVVEDPDPSKVQQEVQKLKQQGYNTHGRLHKDYKNDMYVQVLYKEEK